MVSAASIAAEEDLEEAKQEVTRLRSLVEKVRAEGFADGVSAAHAKETGSGQPVKAATEHALSMARDEAAALRVALERERQSFVEKEARLERMQQDYRQQLAELVDVVQSLQG